MNPVNPQYSDADFNKMRQFIERLFQNPNFQHLPVPEIEGLIIVFFRQNEQQLAGTFISEPYFPGLDWRSVQILFLSVLKTLTLERMQPELHKLIAEKIDFSFLRSYFKDDSYDVEGAALQVNTFLDEIIVNRDVRQGFNPTFRLLRYDYIDKYIEQIFSRREHIYNLMVRGDSLQHLEPFEVGHWLKLSLVLRNVVFLKLPVSNSSGKTQRYNLTDVQEKPSLQRSFLQVLEQTLQEKLELLPSELLKSAIDANRDCNEEVELLSGTARLLGIVSKRGVDYTPWIVVDKGAEQPDKSWFRVAMNNYLYHGLDKNMLEEFFKIAADENW